MEHLYDKLIKYGQGEDYPLHMPGHKRNLCGEMPPRIYQMDITEIDGFDNLHEPEGIIADLQGRIAAFYEADESYCLVGSSTAGILSAISAAIPMGGHILMARNSHKSAYHAAYLRRLQISYLAAPILSDYGIADCVTPQQVAEALDREKGACAVFIVSPTYEGRISPIREIAEVVHERGKILIVDEAHGAHLALKSRWERERQSGFIEKEDKAGDGMMATDILGGADIVIQSLHKTLPAPTQTAVLHVCGDRVDREQLRRFLRIYQSSSPSYVLLAGIDNCVTIMEREGIARYQTFVSRFAELVLELRKCKNIRIFATEFPQDRSGENASDGDGGCAAAKMGPDCQDAGKLLLFPDLNLMTGRQLYDILRERYHIQLEMAAERFCLAMYTIGDTQEGFERLRDALWEIDRELSDPQKRIQGLTPSEDGIVVNGQEKNMASLPCVDMPLYQAWDLEWEEIPLGDCSGRIAADFVNLYPPGTPVLVPGERYTEEIRENLHRWHKQGLHVQGVKWKQEDAIVRCVIEKI